MRLLEITDFLESIAPLRFQESYDNSGLIVGDPQMTISGAMISLDATVEVIDDAISKGCNLVISHHPIVFSGIKKFNNQNYVHKAVIKAIKHDIALYAIHTNLDNVLSNGVNEKFAQKLGLQNLSVLRPHPNANRELDYQVGSGAIGSLDQPLDGSSFIEMVKSKLGLKFLKHTKILSMEISEVAVCGGVGSFLLPAAIDSKAQAFITADYKYHEFFDANDKILIIDVGHYESEFYTIELLHELLSNKFPNFAAQNTEVTTNPVFYS